MSDENKVNTGEDNAEEVADTRRVSQGKNLEAPVAAEEDNSTEDSE